METQCKPQPKKGNAADLSKLSQSEKQKMRDMHKSATLEQMQRELNRSVDTIKAFLNSENLPYFTNRDKHKLQKPDYFNPTEMENWLIN
jgi:hypothetical protein